MEVLKKIFSQTFWQLLAKAVNVLTTVIALGLITRSYGASGVGINSLALTYLAFFFLVTDLGLNAHIISRIHSNPGEINQLFNARLFWSILLVVLSIVLLPIMPFNSPIFNFSVMVASASILLNGIYNSANLVFQYNHAYKYSSIASLGNALVYLPVVLVLIWLKAPVEFLTLATLTGWVLTAGLSLRLVRKYYKFKVYFLKLGYLAQVLKEAWPVSATILVNTVYFRIDAFILSTYRSLAEVGNYNLAYQVFQDGIVLPTFIMNGYYPIMLKTFREDKKAFLKQFKLAVYAMIGLGFLGTIFGYLLSPLIIGILTGGGFGGSVISLRILSLSFPAFFLSALFIWTLIVFKRYKTMLWIYILGFVFNLAANLVYIPSSSYIAASLVTVISEYLILILQIIILLPVFRRIHGSNY